MKNMGTQGCQIWTQSGLNLYQMGQIGGLFEMRFQYILAQRTNLNHFGAKSDIPVVTSHTNIWINVKLALKFDLKQGLDL